MKFNEMYRGMNNSETTTRKGKKGMSKVRKRYASKKKLLQSTSKVR